MTLHPRGCRETAGAVIDESVPLPARAQNEPRGQQVRDCAGLGRAQQPSPGGQCHHIVACRDGHGRTVGTVALHKSRGDARRRKRTRIIPSPIARAHSNGSAAICGRCTCAGTERAAIGIANRIPDTQPPGPTHSTERPGTNPDSASAPFDGGVSWPPPQAASDTKADSKNIRFIATSTVRFFKVSRRRPSHRGKQRHRPRGPTSLASRMPG